MLRLLLPSTKTGKTHLSYQTSSSPPRLAELIYRILLSGRVSTIHLLFQSAAHTPQQRSIRFSCQSAAHTSHQRSVRFSCQSAARTPLNRGVSVSRANPLHAHPSTEEYPFLVPIRYSHLIRFSCQSAARTPLTRGVSVSRVIPLRTPLDREVSVSRANQLLTPFNRRVSVSLANPLHAHLSTEEYPFLVPVRRAHLSTEEYLSLVPIRRSHGRQIDDHGRRPDGSEAVSRWRRSAPPTCGQSPQPVTPTRRWARLLLVWSGLVAVAGSGL